MMIKLRIKTVGACSMHGKGKNVYKFFLENCEGNTPLKRPSSWEDNIG
jgi:hypothetical protein